MPDRFESGTLNNSGIISLGEGINFVNKTGIESIYTKEMHQAQNLYAMLSSIKGVKLYTPAPKYMKSVPIVSFNYKNKSSESVLRSLPITIFVFVQDSIVRLLHTDISAL